MSCCDQATECFCSCEVHSAICLSLPDAVHGTDIAHHATRSALQALPTTHLARQVRLSHLFRHAVKPFRFTCCCTVRCHVCDHCESPFLAFAEWGLDSCGSQETSARFRAALAVLRQATRTLPLKSPGDADVTKGMCEAFEGEHASTLTDELKTKHHLRLEIERLDALLGPPDNPVDADRYWRQRKNLTMRIAGKAQDRHSVMRCLEMLELGLSASHTVALDVQDEWEARHFAALCLRPNYVGSFPVTQIATGEVQQLSLASLSEIEAAFLAHVIAFTAAQAIAVSVEGSKHIKVAPLFRPAPEQSRPRNSEISPGRLVTQESAPEGLAVQPGELICDPLALVVCDVLAG